MERKSYMTLSRWQKKRRRNEISDTSAEATNPKVDSFAAKLPFDASNIQANSSDAEDPLVNSAADNSKKSDLGFQQASSPSASRTLYLSNEDSPILEDERFHPLDSPITNEEKIEAAIVNWALETTVPKSSITSLLHHLSVFFPQIHLTAKTIQPISQSLVSVTDMHLGKYAHFENWPQCIEQHLLQINYDLDTVYVNINVDGLPLFNDSRKNHAYPILIEICSVPFKIVCAGIYLSQSEISNKMPDVDIFLARFVNEITALREDGLKVGEKAVDFQVKAFVCDSPVRCDLKRIVSHAGYHSCERCVEKGSYAGGHVVLLKTDAPLRTDQNFIQKSDAYHHKSGPIPCIEKLGIGLVSGFALDYMHLACIGVMKRLLTRWKSSKKYQKKNHLDAAQLESLDSSIDHFSRSIPSEFSRKLSGGLKSLPYWKATELRTFLLYGGVVVLKDILPSTLYINHLCLCVALRILLSDGQESNVESARLLLVKFISDARAIYGDDFVSYNVHALIHLPDDYLKWGNLNSVNCFRFENYLGAIIKGRLSGRNKPLEQICRHVSIENERLLAKRCRQEPSIGSQKCNVGNFIFKAGPLGSRDNCAMLKCGTIVIIRKICYETLLVDKFQDKSSLFTIPVDAGDIGIFKVKTLEKDYRVQRSDIHSKMMLVPLQDYNITMQLLHV